MTTIQHFILVIWNDLVLNRNGAGVRRNLQLIWEDIKFAVQ